ncbi:MAG: hypothetical protein ABR584_07920 [Candidatus Baltobacteraceae bacterium]
MNSIDLSNKSFEAAVEATTATTNRVLGYLKASFDVVSKPYAVTGPEAFATENFDRTAKLVELREKYLKETGKHVSAVANDTLTHAKQWQDSTQEALKGLGDIMASNLNFVKETTTQNMDGFSKQVATASKN